VTSNRLCVTSKYQTEARHDCLNMHYQTNTGNTTCKQTQAKGMLYAALFPLEQDALSCNLARLSGR